MSIDQRIRDGLRSTNDQLPAADIDRALALVTAAGRPIWRRTLLVSLVAVAAAVLVIVGVLAVTRDGNSSQQPIGPSTPSETTSGADPMADGHLQGADEYLADARPPCATCQEGVPIGFDQATGRLLLSWWDDDSGEIFRLAVVGPDGKLADLSCPDDFACVSEDSYSAGLAILGPGEAELSIQVANKEVQVLGYDGSVRRTIDLSAALPEDQDVFDLAWSPDGTRLAVKADDRHVWLVDREGGEAQLVYTSSPGRVPDTGTNPHANVSGLVWSPDGSRLGLTETFGARFGSSWKIFEQRVVSLQVPGPGEDVPAEATTLYDHGIDPPTDQSRDLVAFAAWSPDGTRVAVRAVGHELELSADDGSVLARHPSIEGYYLVWPASQP